MATWWHTNPYANIWLKTEKFFPLFAGGLNSFAKKSEKGEWKGKVKSPFWNHFKSTYWKQKNFLPLFAGVSSRVSAKVSKSKVSKVNSVIDSPWHKGSGLLSNSRLPRDMADLSQSEYDREVELWHQTPANAERALARKRRLHQGPPTRPASPPPRRVPPSRPASPFGLVADPWLGSVDYPIMI